MERRACPVCMADRDLPPKRERHLRLLGERCIDLDCGDFSGGADKLGGDGGVVSGAATKVESPGTMLR
jgi:hypothetical protein